jgi:hypothetical protein
VIKTLPLLVALALTWCFGCGPDCPDGQEATKSGDCIPLGDDDTLPDDDDDTTPADDDDDTTPADDDDDTTPADDDDDTTPADDDDDTTPADDDDDSASTPVSLATDIQPIFTASCTPCHVGGGSSASLTLDSAYSTLVGVPSSESPLNRVEEGSTQDSYLWHKLQGTQKKVGGLGQQMPGDGGTLTPAELALIEAWIVGGALP